MPGPRLEHQRAGCGAEELRIGFIAPTTGFLSQTGQDMEHGFELYLDDHGGMLGGAKVNLIVEDTQGKPDVAVTKAKKLVLQDHVDMFVGGVLASTGYALAPVSTEEKTLYISSVAAADDLTQRQLEQISLFHPHQPGRARCPTIRSASGPANRATRRSSPSPPTMPSATNRSAVSRRRSRTAAARSSRKSGRRSATRTSGPISRRSRATPTPSTR